MYVKMCQRYFYDIFSYYGVFSCILCIYKGSADKQFNAQCVRSKTIVVSCRAFLIQNIYNEMYAFLLLTL